MVGMYRVIHIPYKQAATHTIVLGVIYQLLLSLMWGGVSELYDQAVSACSCLRLFLFACTASASESHCCCCKLSGACCGVAAALGLLVVVVVEVGNVAAVR